MGRRAWLAAGLALLYPGLGHFYLRAWLRGVGWLALSVSTVIWLLLAGVIPESALTAFESGGIGGMLEGVTHFPVEARLALFVVNGLNVIDAYLTAYRPDRQRDTEGHCPECGRELDMDIDFCPWCTVRLDPEKEADESATSR